MSFKIFLSALFIMFVLLNSYVLTQNKPKLKSPAQTNLGNEKTILVTAYPRGEKQKEIVSKLQNSDFAVLENKRNQRIISVKKAAEAPINLAVVIQDNLDWRINGELNILQNFILRLPEGSRVMTAYLTNGGAIITQELTENRKQSSETLRMLRNISFPPHFSPYDGVQTVLRHFDNTTGRKMVLVVSDGLDMSLGYNWASPYFSISLNKVIKEAQQIGIALFSIYSPSEDRKPYGRFAVNYGQGSLIRLADETGGESYISFGTNISPFFEEFKETFARQWLITYRSSTVGNNFRHIEVTTDFDIHLHHAAGYEPKK